MGEFGNLRRDLRVDVERSEETSLLGSGAFGEVRKGLAVVEGVRRPVAVKYANRLHPREARKSFDNELRVYDSLYEHCKHPRILECFGGNLGVEDSDEEDDQTVDKMFIVLELMDMSLRDLIYEPEHADHRNYRTILLVCAQIAEGLEFLHHNRIVHYDIKPSNVLITEKDGAQFHGRACRFVVKLADFGLSKMRMQRSTAASFKGQVGYMAPEIFMSLHFRGKRATDKVDVYSLGVLIWEFVMQKDRLSESMGESIESVPSPASDNLSESDCYLGSSRFTMPKSVPKDLRDLIGKCVEYRPDTRPACSEVQGTLLKLADEPWALRTPADLADAEDLQGQAAVSIADSAMDRHQEGPPEACLPRINLQIEVEYPDRCSEASSLVGGGPYSVVEKGVCKDDSAKGHRVIVKHAKVVQYRDLFKHELEMFSRLPEHPNIARCYGGSLGQGNGSEPGADRDIFIVIEELGQSWEAFLLDNTVKVKGGKVIRSDTRYFTMLKAFHDVASGLRHCHDNSIIYGNLNPQNVLLNKEGCAKLTSLMFSRFFSDCYSSFHPEIAVVSPELLLGRYHRYQEFTEKMDIFALGAFMWGSLEIDAQAIDQVLRPPRETDNGQEQQGCSGLALSEHYPDELRALILNCTAILPTSRPSCQEVVGSLERMLVSTWVQNPVFKIDVQGVSTVPWICATPTRRFIKNRAVKENTVHTWFAQTLKVLDRFLGYA
ncbi:unnamed protein product [Ostreobium quekettii]|uniref:Protein kinase domain-containing protein n=1 Tax=Ostreobium quekettii TaxID=121088 RepID=A0A8S1JDR6_9CHLO|nr:unnamed protein product [Ostreobium quekettii]|eukprot:evm.model.scf_100EXC.4 EVM.evm.TU.scf_100EXC.4   scf_100EXC:27564-29717(+)